MYYIITKLHFRWFTKGMLAIANKDDGRSSRQTLKKPWVWSMSWLELCRSRSVPLPRMWSWGFETIGIQSCGARVLLSGLR